MQLRPVRAQIYLPVLRFGLTDEDWGGVLVAGIAGYAVPFWLGWQWGRVPLELIGWLVTLALSVGALQLLRRQQRPAWLRHVWQAYWQGPRLRRRLPADAAPAWLRNAPPPVTER